MTLLAEPPTALTTPEHRSLALLSRPDKYILSVDEYVAFRRDGFLIVKNLVSPAEVADIRRHTEDLMQGRLPQQKEEMSDNTSGRGTGVQSLARPPAHLSPEEKADFWLRIHMLHRQLEIHERFLLHPRVIDVLEALIGPDIIAMQSMLFLKGPGKTGQGFHQDSYYIPSYPDSLCGAWLAIDDVDEENGCMYFTKGSQNEPIYPPVDGYGFGDASLIGMEKIANVSDTDESKNTLAAIAKRKYGVTGRGVNETAALMKAGDVAFFGGHVLHRSFTNVSKTRFRRSFVGHYSNARGYTDWGGEERFSDLYQSPSIDPLTGMTNGSHILARGDTHLPFAKPRFNTPCAALIPPHIRRQHRRPGFSMMGKPSGDMTLTPHGTDEDHDKAHAKESKTGY